MGGAKYMNPSMNAAFDPDDSNDDSLEDGSIFLDTTPVDEPLESGGSWLIVFAIAMNKMAFWGVLPCFGFVFADVLSTRPGLEGASIASIVSAFNIALDVASICSPAFYKRFSYRQVGTAGGLVFFAGTLTAAFSVSVTQLVLTYGVLQGAGFGLTVSASLASFTHHFAWRRRTQAMALALCASGGGGLALPLAAHALQAAHGARAAKAAFAALSAAAAAAQLLLRPPPRVEDGSMDCTECHFPTHLPDAEYNGNKRAWWRGAAARAWRVTGLEARVVLDPLVLLVALGVALVHMLESSLIAMLPLHLRALLDEVGVARAVTSLTAGDFAGRLLLLLGGRWLGQRNRLVFGLSALVAAASVLGLALTWAWGGVVALAALLGVSKGALYVTLFLALAEIVAPANFPSAAAAAFAAQMLCSLTVSPAVGAVRDATGSFRVCFGVVAALLALTPLLWALHAALSLRGRRSPRS